MNICGALRIGFSFPHDPEQCLRKRVQRSLVFGVVNVQNLKAGGNIASPPNVHRCGIFLRIDVQS